MSKEKKHGFAKFLLGAGVGVGLGILFAPKSGKETREELKTKLSDLSSKVSNLTAEDVKKAFETKITEIKEELKSLDKETVTKNIKDTAHKIKTKTDELVDLAVKKGTPVIESAAREVKRTTVKTLENITSKLKEEEPTKKNVKKTTKTSK